MTDTVRREQPQIERATNRMLKSMRGLSGVSQKQALSQLMYGWIKAIYPHDREKALLLSEHMREQVDVYLNEMDGEPLH